MKRLVKFILVVLVGVVITNVFLSAEIKVNGIGQVQIINEESSNDTITYFTIKRARLIAKGNVADKVGLFVQLEAFTKEINILDLVIDYDLGTIGKLGIGRFTIPFGAQNPVSVYDLHTINYAQVVQKLVGSGGRDFGLRLIGSYNLVNWRLALINGSDGGTTVNSSSENNKVKDIIARIGVVPVEKLNVGGSIYIGKSGVNEVEKTRYGVDVSYLKDPIYAQAEYIQGKDGDLEKAGYYLELGYKIGKIQPIVRYDVYDGDTSVEDSSEINIIAAGLNLYIAETAKVQLIYEIKNDKLGTNLEDIKNNVLILQTAVKF